MVWGASHPGQGDLVSSPVTTTSLSDPCVAGATTIQLDSAAGLAVGSILHIGPIGAPRSEPARIEQLPTILNLWRTASGFGDSAFNVALRHDHLEGTVVTSGPADHRSNFGHTSSSAALSSGVAALMLSANPALTFVEVRGRSCVTPQSSSTSPTATWMANGAIATECPRG